jgi:SAM-dependent methyltransferase
MNSQDIAAGAARSGDEDGPEEHTEHARRASSFGSAAAAYALHRPDYPVAAIRWALEPVATSPGRRMRLIDLGAGTGKLTAQLAALDLPGGSPEVIAVEPDPDMLAEFRRQVRGAASAGADAIAGPAVGAWYPGVRAMAGRAEAIPLPGTWADAVLAGQAAHWFELDQAMPEIARVLRPGGVFAGLWNADDDRVDWVAGLHRASGRRNIATLSALTADDDGAMSAWLGSGGQQLFGPLEHAAFEHEQARTAESLIATMRTHSMFLVMDPDEREAALAGVREYLATAPATAAGEFLLPLCTLTLRAVRR